MVGFLVALGHIVLLVFAGFCLLSGSGRMKKGNGEPPSYRPRAPEAPSKGEPK